MSSRRRYGHVELQAGERLVATFSHDFAMCDCPADGAMSGVPTIAVVLCGDGRARCLACGRSWLVPERRRADRMSGAGVR